MNSDALNVALDESMEVWVIVDGEPVHFTWMEALGFAAALDACAITSAAAHGATTGVFFETQRAAKQRAAGRITSALRNPRRDA